MRKALVTGAGGFIGTHLVSYLKDKGYWVRGVDIKYPEFSTTDTDEFLKLDLRRYDNCLQSCMGVDEVYNLAADMGGIGFISSSKAHVCRNNSLINLNMLEAATKCSVEKLFYSSSACVYPLYLQKNPDVTPLKEEHIFPYDPEHGYGEEKLYAERVCEYYKKEFGLNTSVARFHNVFGPLGTYEGGREKAPAAICRKVSLAQDGDVIEVWGDGEQTRSFLYVSDCCEGIYRLIHSGHHKPLNLGSDRLVSIKELVDMVSSAAGKSLEKKYDLSKPQGVRGRNSDNTKMKEILNWQPEVSLEDGLKITYEWVLSQKR